MLAGATHVNKDDLSLAVIDAFKKSMTKKTHLKRFSKIILVFLEVEHAK